MRPAVTFSVFGCCVSYDIVSNYERKSVCGLCSWMSIAYGAQLNRIIELDELNLESFEGFSHYRKRNICHELNKSFFEYLKADKSDYLIFDALDCRFSVLYFSNSDFSKGNYITLRSENEYEIFKRFIDELYQDCDNQFKKVVPLDFDDNSIILLANQICDEIFKIYPPEKCIYNELFFADEYMDDEGEIVRFNKKYSYDDERRIIKLINETVERRLNGSGHIIPSLEACLGAKNNKYGTPYPLHYIDLVYEYGQKCIDLIVDKHSDEELILEMLADEY